MKLSKQERIAAIVVVVLVILVAGVFVFIKPNIETIIATKETLATKKKEFEDDEARAATKEPLKAQILKAYDDGKNLADMFFPELKSYEADNEFRAFLDQCANRANLHVESLQISEPGTAGLSASAFTPPSTQYALKNYVNQGVTETETDGNLLRQRMIYANLGEPQTIGATTVSFKLYATSIDDVLKFADEVNNYEMTQNGKKVRKAISLNGVGFLDKRTQYLLDKRGVESLDDAIEAGAKAFVDYLANSSRVTRTALAENPTDAAAPDAPAAPDNNVGVDIDNDEETFDFYLYTLDCTITFYSIERMSDPTPILTEQDKVAVPVA